MTAATPTTVTLVSFGESKAHFSPFMSKVEERDDWFVLNVRTWLTRDPRSSVGKGEDGATEQTQKMVIGQEGFIALVLFCFNIVTGADSTAGTFHNLALYCTRGDHRSNVVCRMLESLLNSIVDFEGDRKFNANHFPLSRA